jgi:hypothetical protein
VRRFLKNPGAILERLREEHDAAADAGDLEARKKGLAKRLAARQGEKDRYVRAYAQGHISEEELDAYLDELKKQIDNLRVLLASVEAELSERQERKSLTDTTQAWLLSLGGAWRRSRRTRPRGSRSASSSSGSWWPRPRSVRSPRTVGPRSESPTASVRHPRQALRALLPREACLCLMSRTVADRRGRSARRRGRTRSW